MAKAGDRVSEIVAPNYHYRYQYGFVGGVGTVWQQNELTSNTMLQMTFDQSYGMPVDVFDGFGWRKKYYYSGNTGLGFFPKNITYYRQDNGGSSMQTYLTYDNGMRLTYKENNVLDKREYFTYNTNGLLSQSSYLASSGYQNIYTASGNLTFTRDNSGIINSITGDKQLSATYDGDLEITGVQHTLPQPINEAYTYDSRGNRLTSSANTFTYDDLNRLTSSAINTYTYDADGNMTMEKNPLTGERKVFTYDSENRMVKYEHYVTDVSPVDVTAVYTYDLFGRRLQKNVNGAITNFYWEGDTVGLELDANYQPIRKYVTGAGMDDYEGHLEYSEITDWSHIFDNVTQQAWYSYMRDQVGTIYKVYDHRNHAIAESRTYDTFGNVISQSGTPKTNFGFQGKYYDSESGLNYFYQRYYLPTIGRFIIEDPIRFEGGGNFYQFVENNSINNLDPFGLSDDSCKKKDKDNKRNCRMEFFACMGRCVLGAPDDPLSGIAAGAQVGGQIATQIYSNQAFQIAASRFLAFPMRSSIVRGSLQSAGRAGIIGSLIGVIICEYKCFKEEIKCLNEN